MLATVMHKIKRTDKQKKRQAGGVSIHLAGDACLGLVPRSGVMSQQGLNRAEI